MQSTTGSRREALRQSLIDIAERQIANDGQDSLKARGLAIEAGCSVGAIYNVFDDLAGLILEVNGRTFQHLGAALSDALAGSPKATARQKLFLMARAYLDFATENENAWRCLFGPHTLAIESIPDWYIRDLNALLAMQHGPLKDIFTDMTNDDIALLSRAMFSSVHGIVLQGLDNRPTGVPQQQIVRMLELILDNIGPPAHP